MIPGVDPVLKDEVIIVGAHYDHVGFGSRKNSFGPYGTIHPGADDNASGTSALLELAKAFGVLPETAQAINIDSGLGRRGKGPVGFEALGCASHGADG